MLPLIVSFLQIRCIFQKRTPSKSDTFLALRDYVHWSFPVNCCWPDSRSTCEWTRKKRHVYCLMFWNWASWIILRLHPFTVNTSHQVGKARCLDAMQTLKKGASFFSEPWHRCFNCLFFHFFCLGYVTCHVDGVFLWFRIVIKFTLS